MDDLETVEMSDVLEPHDTNIIGSKDSTRRKRKFQCPNEAKVILIE